MAQEDLYLVQKQSPCGNTPQGTNYTATCLPSRKLSKLDEPDRQDTAGEAGTNLLVMYSYGPPHMAEKSGTTSSNMHTAAMGGYGM